MGLCAAASVGDAVLVRSRFRQNDLDQQAALRVLVCQVCKTIVSAGDLHSLNAGGGNALSFGAGIELGCVCAVWIALAHAMNIGCSRLRVQTALTPNEPLP
jgi:hypothetical protein